MSGFAELEVAVPNELVDESMKRLSYVSEGVYNVRLLPGSTRVSFDLRRGFEGQEKMVAASIAEIAAKLCTNYRPDTARTLVKRDFQPSFQDDPHPLFLASGNIVEFGRGRYGFGPRLVR